jgi:hypothetical protein
MTPDTLKGKARDDDPHETYLAAVADWERADRTHHSTQVAVMHGDRGATDALATAAARLEWATDTALIERHRAGRRWLMGMKYALEDDSLRHAALMLLLDVLRPALEPVADRLDDIELLTAAHRGAA